MEAAVGLEVEAEAALGLEGEDETSMSTRE